MATANALADQLPGPAPEVATRGNDPRHGRLGIARGNYVALGAPDPEAAATFATTHMGFDLVHVDEDGRHYLAGAGLDAYSLVYAPSADGGLDHVSYVVPDAAALLAAEDALGAAGVACERVDRSPLWRHREALRFRAPTGATIELTPGVAVDVPMSEAVRAPSRVPGPIAFDHLFLRCASIDELLDWPTEVLGLRESGRIQAPDGSPLLAFYRCGALFHCFGLARSTYDGLHHCEFTLKNDRAVMEAYKRMSEDPAVELLWGPVRHGCGQNIAFYFRDAVGTTIEFSAQEEVILGTDTYEVQHWSVANARAVDEWGSHPPEAITS